MQAIMKKWRIFGRALAVTLSVLALKLIIHFLGWEAIELSSLHTSVIAGSFFVISFILSATIADYKESEKVPAEFSAIVENMYEDGLSIRKSYPKFDFTGYQRKLVEILDAFKEDAHKVTRETHHLVHHLSVFFVEMEKAGVPPNYIVKLKQEQGQLTKALFRIYYIQTIQFIPSAFVLAQAVIGLSVALLLITAIEPFTVAVGLTAIISFIFVYILLLIRVISTPFHHGGKTMDDISLFLIDRARRHVAGKD